MYMNSSATEQWDVGGKISFKKILGISGSFS